MIGQIESYDPNTQSGTIKAEETLFTFDLQDWLPAAAPDVGDEVNFDNQGTVAGNINLLGATLQLAKPVKYKYLAALLALFLGWTGAHRFYLGFYRLGFTQLALTAILVVTGLAGFAALWGFIEGILLFGGQIHQDAKGRPLK